MATAVSPAVTTTASLSSTHPSFSQFVNDWVLMRDGYSGERAVKSKSTLYLPATANQISDGYGQNANTIGFKAYEAYKMRARYPNFLRESVQMAIGMMHSEAPKFTLPEAMKDIRSSKGETLPQLLRRINTEQLLTGRIGLLAELPRKAPIGKDMPYIATYVAEKVINWDDGEIGALVPQTLNLVVFDETEMVRNGFSWESKTKHRVLSLGPVATNEPGAGSVYRMGVFDEFSGYNEAALRAVSFRGRQLNRIPFVFVNVCDLINDPDNPPLLDLGNLCLTIYRGEADYRQNLFMQGQDTFVTIGGNFEPDDTIRVGAGQRIDLPLGGDAKYEGVSAAGLTAQREALEDDRGRAGSMGAQTMDTVSRERESGTSLNIRMAARTADLKQIAMAGGEGLQRILMDIAEWMGEDPKEVKVEPNLEFNGNELSGQTMVEMQTARNLGWPISAKSLHQVSVNKGFTTLTFEEELAQAEKEKGTIFERVDPAAGADQNPDNDPAKNKSPKDKQKEKTGGARK